MTKTAWRLLLVPIWVGALWGSLQIHRLDLDLGHGICGAWGCGPPLEALLGYHSFWSLVILPLAICVGWYLPSLVSRKVGGAVLLISVIGTMAFVGWDVVTWGLRAERPEFLLRRGLFTLVTSVDIPMIPTMLAGALLMFVFGRGGKSGVGELPTSESAAPLDTNGASPFAAPEGSR